MVVILTDGYENASVQYNHKQIIYQNSTESYAGGASLETCYDFASNNAQDYNAMGASVAVSNAKSTCKI